MPQYWVVGAMYSGHDDQAPKFIRRGYWVLGWDDADAPDQAKRRDEIRAGDRIAIKRMMGQGATEIRITGLGVVTEVDEDDKRVYVNWIANDLDRVVESRGCFKTIHGPFEADDPWVKEVFRL
jgi:hypothetical protein